MPNRILSDFHGQKGGVEFGVSIFYVEFGEICGILAMCVEVG